MKILFISFQGYHEVRDDRDSDSAYSGDVSNTDSGRGPSEEGENHHHNGKQLESIDL